MKAFHGYITEGLLALGTAPGMTFKQNGVRVHRNSWMTPGDPATFIIVEDDLDIPTTMNTGRVARQLSCFILPGHLNGADWTAAEAAREIADAHFRDCPDARHLIEALGEYPAPRRERVEEIVERVIREMEGR